MWHIRQQVGNEQRIIRFKTQKEVVKWLEEHLPEQPSIAYAVHIRFATPPVPPTLKKTEPKK